MQHSVVSLLLAAVMGLWSALLSAGTADHSRFEILQGPFSTGEEVTRACLSCHTEASRQVMATRHWSWEYENADTGQKLGKRTMLNGFCIGNKSNEAFCQSCHVGYGWEDDSFDFTAEEKSTALPVTTAAATRRSVVWPGIRPTSAWKCPRGRANLSNRLIWWQWPRPLAKPADARAAVVTSMVVAVMGSNTAIWIHRW